ncbi:MAG: hypothetical protein JWO56_973 [Acidobacteria bacterium]|nr:hypothetical protein [Acidobacteriota bacterium]
MTEPIILTQLVGGPYCVSSADGSKVHDTIAERLQNDEDVIVSFAGVEDVTSAFLNSAIGQLYSGDFNEDQIRRHLKVVDAEGDHLALLKRVVDRAKEFFRDPEHYHAAITGALGD